MIEADHPDLSIGKQCRLLSISRSSFHYSPLGETDVNLSLMRVIDKRFWRRRFAPPDIMNTDQGSQFTSFAWADRLKRAGCRISMDGKGRCIDNVFMSACGDRRSTNASS